jgi:hypothetical protein
MICQHELGADCNSTVFNGYMKSTIKEVPNGIFKHEKIEFKSAKILYHFIQYHNTVSFYFPYT